MGVRHVDVAHRAREQPEGAVGGHADEDQKRARMRLERAVLLARGCGVALLDGDHGHTEPGEDVEDGKSDRRGQRYAGRGPRLPESDRAAQ